MKSINRPDEGTVRPRPLIAIYITRGTVLWALIGVFACAAVYDIFSDTLTMTAYYPSPQGSYYKLTSTDQTSFAYRTSPSSVVSVGCYKNALNVTTCNTNATLLVVGNVANPVNTVEVAGKINASQGVTYAP